MKDNKPTPSIEAIDALLPQTQCGECGYKGCKPYAVALAERVAPINKCPPGGIDTLRALGQLFEVDASPYESAMEQKTRAPSQAVIREAECIGCTKCLQACPVDAIIGAAKFMHTVLAHECTGCGLCVEPCPVDCIDMQPLAVATYDKALARRRAEAREVRLLGQQQQEQHVYHANKKTEMPEDTPTKAQQEAKRAFILEALARVEAKKKA